MTIGARDAERRAARGRPHAAASAAHAAFPQPSSARDHEPSFGEVIAGLLLRAAGDIRVHGSDWRARGRAEPVHQLRVAIRRLRSALSAARRRLPALQVKALRTEAREVATAVGGVRKIDVFVHETLPAVASRSDDAAQAPLSKLRIACVRQRGALQRKARAAVSAERLARLVADADALAASCIAEDADARLRRPARKVGAKVLERRHERLVERMDDVAGLGDDALHALRIAAKKQRYLCEAFEALFAKRRYRRYCEGLVAVQRVLGDMRDAAAAATLATEAGANDAALEAIADWASKRRRKDRRALVRAARKLRDVAPFRAA